MSTAPPAMRPLPDGPRGAWKMSLLSLGAVLDDRTLRPARGAELALGGREHALDFLARLDDGVADRLAAVGALEVRDVAIAHRECLAQHLDLALHRVVARSLGDAPRGLLVGLERDEQRVVALLAVRRVLGQHLEDADPRRSGALEVLLVEAALALEVELLRTIARSRPRSARG